MKPPYGPTPRSLLDRLVSGRDERAECGVRRRRLAVRPPDQPTQAIQVLAIPERPGQSAQPNPTLVVDSLPHPESRLQPQVAPQSLPARPAAPPPPATLPADQTVYVSAIPDKPRAVCAVLVGIEGSLEGEVYKIHDGANKLGRGDACDVVLESVRISRFHAQIRHDDGGFIVEANAEIMENNPTMVNGSEIDAEGLFDGDVLKLGDSSFAFRTISSRARRDAPCEPSAEFGQIG